MNTSRILFLLLLICPGGPIRSQERIRVVTTTETLRAIVEAVGGERVEVVALGRGFEDPHYVVPTPTLMVKASDADLFVEIGLSLELWAEGVIDGSRNNKIRRGGEGHVFAASGIRALDIPAVVGRAEGDVHPGGNPHVWLDPLNAKVMADGIAIGLTRIDPDGRATYEGNAASFGRRIDEAMFGTEILELLGTEYVLRLQRAGGLIAFLEETEWEGRPLLGRLAGWRAKMLPLRGQAIVTYHKAWPYFAEAFEIELAAQLEPKPGISPTPAHLARVRQTITDRGVRAIWCAPYFDFAKARAVASETGIQALRVPTEVGGDEAATDFFALFDRITDLALEGR